MRRQIYILAFRPNQIDNDVSAVTSNQYDVHIVDEIVPADSGQTKAESPMWWLDLNLAVT